MRFDFVMNLIAARRRRNERRRAASNGNTDAGGGVKIEDLGGGRRQMSVRDLRDLAPYLPRAL